MLAADRLDQLHHIGGGRRLRVVGLNDRDHIKPHVARQVIEYPVLRDDAAVFQFAAERGEFVRQRVERPGVVLGIGPVCCGVGGIEIGKLPRDGTGHLRGHARAGEQVRVHPPMMVPLMLLVRRFRVRVREQPGDALGAVDGMKFLLGACRRGTEEGFKAEPIEYEDVGLCELAHVLRREGVIVGASGLRGEHELHLHIRHVLRDVTDDLVDGESGGEHPGLSEGGTAHQREDHEEYDSGGGFTHRGSLREKRGRLIAIAKAFAITACRMRCQEVCGLRECVQYRG